MGFIRTCLLLGSFNQSRTAGPLYNKEIAVPFLLCKNNSVCMHVLNNVVMETVSCDIVSFVSTSVEEVDDYSAQLESCTDVENPPASLPPRRDLQIRPPIRSPSPTPQTTATETTAPKRAPMAPPKPQRPTEMDNPNFKLDMESQIKDSTYFILSPTGESIPQDEPQGTYEEMGYDEKELNRNPPPVWKPTTQQQGPHNEPPSSPSSAIIYSRVEARNIVNHPHRAPHTAVKNRYEATRQPPHPLPKQAGASLQTRPKAVVPPHLPKNTMKGIVNDPALKEKLHEKRQELYGQLDNPRTSVSSCESTNPMENYEEICFDLVGIGSNSDEDLPLVFSRETNMTLPPRRHNIGSEIAMLQCPQETPKAQEYLSFQPSPSHSPQGSTSDLSKRDSHTSVTSLSPLLQRKSLTLPEGVPQLPPRDTERMREGSSRLVGKPIPQHSRTAGPPVAPRARPKRPLKLEKSSSQEEIHCKPLPNSRNLPPRPLSSSFESPPPVPHRNTGDRSKLTLPSRPCNDPIVEAPPAPPRHRQVPILQHPSDESTSPPPPVPIRKPNASGASLSESELRSYLETVNDDDAPPVPSRGARHRAMPPSSSNPSLQRPHSTPETNEPHFNSRPPVRPAHVGEIDTHAPAQAWDDRASTSRHLPKPPVTPKPRPAPKPQVNPRPSIASKPAISTKPPTAIKPKNINSMPPVSSKTTKPPKTARKDKPTPATRTLPTSHQNGEIPPPLPPR